MAAQATSTNIFSTDRLSVSIASTPTRTNVGGSSFVYLGDTIPIDATTLPNADLPIDTNMPDLEDASETLSNDGDPSSTVQTKGKIQKASSAQQALDEIWVKAMQEELLQFKLQQVWILVDLPFGKKAIGTKWVLRNKRDERSIVVKNKARLIAQGHRQEVGIDYDEVFAPVGRIEAIRLFLAFASFMGFLSIKWMLKVHFSMALL
ncbi:putative ribonuclease H-like domain-containing protein, partial [Tanacetum coccineum]